MGYPRETPQGVPREGPPGVHLMLRGVIHWSARAIRLLPGLGRPQTLPDPSRGCDKAAASIPRLLNCQTADLPDC